MTTSTRDRGQVRGPAPGPVAGLGPVAELARLASPDPGAGAELAGFRGLPGLAARLAAMAAELRMVTRSFPTWCMPEVGVGDAIEQAQAVRELAHTLCAVLAGEVTSRGLGAREGLSRTDWVAAHAPVLEGAAAAELTAVGAVMSEPRWRALAGKVRCGTATVAKAAAVVRFHDQVAGFADRQHLDRVVDAMVDQIEVLGVKEVRRLVRQARLSLRPPQVVASEDARLRAGRALSRIGRSAGLIEYRLRLDPEGAAVLDAAIDPLARPRPDLDWDGHLAPYRHPICGHPDHGHPDHGHPDHGHPDHGHADHGHPAPEPGDRRFPTEQDAGHPDAGATCETCETCETCATCETCETCASPPADPRLPATRRADALLELVGRAVAAPQGVTRTPRTKLVVTISHEALLEQIHGAGLADNDEVLSAATVRRLACEAQIIPVVLGAPSQLLDLGSTKRYFTPAQRLALAARDHGCSYPGCTVPPQWCEAHHVTPWSRGGPTDLTNGALLCGRHHTRVHELGLTAQVTPWDVTWHRPPPPEHHPPPPATTAHGQTGPAPP